MSWIISINHYLDRDFKASFLHKTAWTSEVLSFSIKSNFTKTDKPQTKQVAGAHGLKYMTLKEP